MRLIEVDVLKAWIENWFTKNRHYHPYAKNNNIPITELYDILEQMPSAQQEQQHGKVFKGIVVEYPSYSPSSEYKGKPYFSIKYTENGQEFIGYGTYKPEVLSEYLKTHFIFTQPEQQWTPCSERLPEKPDTYTVTDSKGDVVRFVFDDSASSREYWLRCAKAWMPLPKPYEEDKMNDLISRQAAIDALQHIDTSILSYKDIREYEDAPILEMRKRLEKLPSAQPEIIRCKDCKHWCINKRLDIPWCRNLHIDRGADDFCSCAERKTDG